MKTMVFNRFLMAGLPALMAAGLVAQANAGVINLDFTSDAATKIVGATSNNEPASTPAAHDWVDSTASGLTAKMGVDMQPFGFATGVSVDITATRSAVVRSSRVNQVMRMTRWNDNGLAICSDIGSGGCDEAHTVDGAGVDESVKFAFSDGTGFAIRYVTFGYSDNNDDAVMKFMTNLTSSLNIEIDYHNANASYDYSTCSNLTSSSSSSTVQCTIDVYKLAALSDGVTPGAIGNNLVYDAAYDLKPGDIGYDPAKDYSKGQDAIYNFLASSAGFEFKALGDNDNWKIRHVTLVVEDLPEPSSMTLLGAGLAWLACLSRRRRAHKARANI